MDPSLRYGRKYELFPPFVVTHTVDIFHNEQLKQPIDSARVRSKLDLYQDQVEEAINRAINGHAAGWDSLRLMGRPLWAARTAATETRGLGRFAARKLLGGSAFEPASLCDKSLFGVAAVLYRLGVRVNAFSPLASRLIADFMAVLSYMSHQRDQQVVSYGSDPVLSLGAAHIWYAMSATALEDKLLPQLRKLLDRQQLMDTDTSTGGGLRDLVATQIVLLLAMDACGELRTGRKETRWMDVGEFSSVWTLLQVLHGEPPSSPQTSQTAHLLREIETQWRNWWVSFTHFVQLPELPTQETLWVMAGRRAAGVPPPNHGHEVDFVIPNCRKATKTEPVSVSMILVQVASSIQGDVETALSKMRPSVVFQGTPLAQISTTDVLRILINLRREPHEAAAAASYIVDQSQVTGTRSCALYLRGLAASWSCCQDKATSEEEKTIQVVTPAVLEQLEMLLSPVWKIADIVEQDVQERAKFPSLFGMSEADLQETALRPLAESLLFSKVAPHVRQGVCQGDQNEETKSTTTSEGDGSLTDEMKNDSLKPQPRCKANEKRKRGE